MGIIKNGFRRTEASSPIKLIYFSEFFEPSLLQIGAVLSLLRRDIAFLANALANSFANAVAVTGNKESKNSNMLLTSLLFPE